MNLRVLLLKSTSLVSKVAAYTPPLGIMCLSSYVRRRCGAQTRLVDLGGEPDPRAAALRAVEQFQPHLIGISALTAEAFLLHEVATLCRQAAPHTPIVVGGPYASFDPTEALGNAAIDVVAVGEGEQTLAELVELVADGGRAALRPDALRDVIGTAWRDVDGQVQLSAERPFLDDLDSLPFPDWDGVDLPRFWDRPSMATVGVRPYATIFTSRGCPFRCTYCHDIFGKRFRARSPESVADEVSELFSRYGPLDIEILDDIANHRRDRLQGIFRLLLERDLHPLISFPNGVRTDLLDEDTIDLYRAVGTGEISVAVETASPRIQKLVKKHLNLDKVSRNIDLLARKRVFTRGFFMVGFPTETTSEMRATLRYALRSRLHMALFFTVNPFAGTALHQGLLDEGRILESANHVDYEYFGAPFNASEVPDWLFRTLYRSAWYRFYMDPRRVARIARDRPYHNDIPRRIKRFFLERNVTSFRTYDEAGIEDFQPRRW